MGPARRPGRPAAARPPGRRCARCGPATSSRRALRVCIGMTVMACACRLPVLGPRRCSGAAPCVRPAGMLTGPFLARTSQRVVGRGRLVGLAVPLHDQEPPQRHNRDLSVRHRRPPSPRPEPFAPSLVPRGRYGVEASAHLRPPSTGVLGWLLPGRRAVEGSVQRLEGLPGRCTANSCQPPSTPPTCRRVARPRRRAARRESNVDAAKLVPKAIAPWIPRPGGRRWPGSPRRWCRVFAMPDPAPGGAIARWNPANHRRNCSSPERLGTMLAAMGPASSWAMMAACSGEGHGRSRVLMARRSSMAW